MEFENRRQRRRQLIFYLPVHDRATGEKLGLLGDITTEGLLIISREAIPEGQVLELEIVNNTSHPLPTPLRLRGESRWSHPDVNPDYYATGVELLEVDARTQGAIGKLVSEIGFTDH
ncbi:PilZ domain-containing protein [Ectothiorhodospiraceae bacterium WFHF3C12]|nr:PilZ domain-containing protein [Ectothiorhodospiraceae bacterium WFHF3C12]